MSEEFENVVEETNENVEAETTEEIQEGIELTDTANADETKETNAAEEKKEEKPQGRYVTDEELNNLANEIADKRVARKMSKLERDYESKLAEYQDIENVLNAGLGTSNIKEATEKVRESYSEQGVKLPDRVVPTYSHHDNEILAKAEANEIIEDGYEAMVSEANRLAQKGYANMTDREKIIFTTLGDKLTEENDKKELLKLGAKEELLKDNDFLSFKKKFNSDVPIQEIYDMYSKNKPKSKVENPGSMKNTNPVIEKDYYSPEDVEKLTSEDWNKPGIWEKVRASQKKWK